MPGLAEEVGHRGTWSKLWALSPVPWSLVGTSLSLLTYRPSLPLAQPLPHKTLPVWLSSSIVPKEAWQKYHKKLEFSFSFSTSNIWNHISWLNSRKLKVSCDTRLVKCWKKTHSRVLLQDVSKPTCRRQGQNVTSEKCFFHSLVVCRSSLPYSYIVLLSSGSVRLAPQKPCHWLPHSNWFARSSKIYLWMCV